MLAFAERGKPEYQEKNLSEQSREPTVSDDIWRRVFKSLGTSLAINIQQDHDVCRVKAA